MVSARLSRYVTLAEATQSAAAKRLGIDNNPNPNAAKNLKAICLEVFDPIREHFGTPIAISSGYRSPALNQALAGSTKSQHCTGEALDLNANVYGGCTNAAIFHFIATHLNFDQLIWEFGDKEDPAWVHVSLRPIQNRKETLKARRRGRTTIYHTYI